MDKLLNLVDLLRKRSLGFKAASDKCLAPADKLALCARADEVDRCAAAIEEALSNTTYSTERVCQLCGSGHLITPPTCTNCGQVCEGAE